MVTLGELEARVTALENCGKLTGRVWGHRRPVVILYELARTKHLDGPEWGLDCRRTLG